MYLLYPVKHIGFKKNKKKYIKSYIYFFFTSTRKKLVGTMGTALKKCQNRQYLCGFEVYPLASIFSGYKVGTVVTFKEIL